MVLKAEAIDTGDKSLNMAHIEFADILNNAFLPNAKSVQVLDLRFTRSESRCDLTERIQALLLIDYME